MSCNPDKIKAALFEEAENTTDFVRELIDSDPRVALRLVPDGGVVRRNASKKTVIYGEGRQAPTAYRDLDNDPRALVEGEMTARTLTGANGIFETDINDLDDNACHGHCTIDFAQGYRERLAIDKAISLDTPVKCVRELDRLGREHIEAYFRGFRRQFSRYGLDNFNDNLLNLIIQQGEANSSVLAFDQFNVSTAGWVAPPTHRVTIFWLQEWREQILHTMRGFGWNVPDDWLFEIEMPRDDWFDAVQADQLARNPDGTVYNTEIFVDQEGPLRRRSYAVWGNIKCYFNERPIRGFYRQTGTSGGNPVFNFVRVYDWINEVGETGGVVTRANHQYRQDTITVDGITYDMVTLIPHIDKRSFKRYGLIKPLKPAGGRNSGVNYDVRVVDGAYIPCNEHDDKFKLVARHEFRFKAIYPEVSGFLAYRHGRRSGYNLSVVPRDQSPVTNSPANPEVFQSCVPDPCMQAECEQCNQLPAQNGQCEDPGEVTPGVLSLVPCSAASSAFLGEAYTVRLEVHRTGLAAGTATVDYTVANGTTTGTDITTGSGTLAWGAGDTTPRFIDVPVLATFAASPSKNFTVTLSNEDGDDLACAATTVTVEDLTA